MALNAKLKENDNSECQEHDFEHLTMALNVKLTLKAKLRIDKSQCWERDSER